MFYSKFRELKMAKATWDQWGPAVTQYKLEMKTRWQGCLAEQEFQSQGRSCQHWTGKTVLSWPQSFSYRILIWAFIIGYSNIGVNVHHRTTIFTPCFVCCLEILARIYIISLRICSHLLCNMRLCAYIN